MPSKCRKAAIGRVSIIIAVLAVSGCATTVEQDAQRAQWALIGMPKGALLSCAGVPDRQAQDGDREFLTYVSRRVDVVHDDPPWFGPGWGPSPWSPWYRGPATTQTTDCEATFTLSNGKVSRLVYGGDGANGIYSQCATIVRNCLPPLPPLPDN